MSKQFIRGKKYVFTKKKFVKMMGKVHSEEKRWVNGFNGKQVILHSQFIGVIEDVPIIPLWCKCIKDIKKNPCQRVQVNTQ